MRWPGHCGVAGMGPVRAANGDDRPGTLDPDAARVSHAPDTQPGAGLICHIAGCRHSANVTLAPTAGTANPPPIPIHE